MKMTKRNTMAAVLAVLIVFSFAISAFSEEGCAPQDRKGMFRQRVEAKKQELIAELQLTPDQQAVMESIRSANRDEMKEMSQAMKNKRQELAEELKKYDSDPAVIEAKKAELKEILSVMVDARVDNILEMKEVLNAEQYEKFVAKAQEFKDKWKHKRSGGKIHDKPW